MRNPSHRIAQRTARTLTLICLAGLLAFAAYSWMPQLQRVLAEGSMTSRRLTGAKINHAPLKLQRVVEGDRSLNFGESRDLQGEYVGSKAAIEALDSGSARATALASSDFDEDGTPDLLSDTPHRTGEESSRCVVAMWTQFIRTLRTHWGANKAASLWTCRFCLRRWSFN